MNLVRRVASLEARPLLRIVPPEPVAFDTPADVVAVIAEQVNAVRADPWADPAEKARTLGFLAGVALRAMEAKDLAARLEAVERVLKLRRGQQQDALKRRR
jgi:hypothetical protein